MANWYEMIKMEFEENKEDFKKMKTTLTDEELIKDFDDGYGGIKGEPFTAWGEKFVYFPVCYDGAESVGSAPRDHCDIKTGHQGGG